MLSFLLIVIAALFFTGIINRTKSIFSGRKGPGIFQPLKDVMRLFRKESIYSDTTSFIFRLAPSVYFSSVVMAMLVVPFGQSKGLISFSGDFIFFAYVLALGKFFNIIGALIPGAVSREWAPAGKPSTPCLRSRLFRADRLPGPPYRLYFLS